MTLSGIVALASTLGAASFYFFIGCNALRRPERLLASFDLIATTTAARNEVRAIYGGMTISLALILLSTLVIRATAAGVVVAVAALTLGMAGGRMVSAIVDGAFEPAPRFWCGAEIVVALALAVTAWLRM